MSQPLDENRILALSPPFIQGKVDLQTPENYHAGISLDTDKDDLRIFVDPWIGMALKDKCQMSYNGVNVGTIPVDENNLNQRLEFKIPRAQVTNGAALVFYTVKRLGQEPVSSEPVLRMWVQLTRPGGLDRDSEDGHSGLLYTLSPDPLTISRLPAATIWVNNQNVTTIDLKVLGTSDADARVYFTPPDFQIGEEIELRCTGQTPEGVPVTIGPLVHTVGAVPGHFDFKLANASIRAMVNGSATTNYKLLRANVPARPSNDVVVPITGEVSQLKPPTVVEAPDYKLDPNRHQNGFTVVFDTAAFDANHEVKLEIAGTPGAGSVPPQQKPVAGQSKVQFDIDFSVTGANLQRSVELIYSLIVDGQPTPVQSMTLVIGELLQSSMPIPKFGVFLDDLTTFENYNWNRWAQSTTNALSNIVFSSSEYFLETRSISGASHGIYLSKCFQNIQTGTQLEFSFDYRSAAPTTSFLAQNNARENLDLRASGSWQPMIVRFRSEASSTPNTLMLILYAFSSQILSIKNLRLKTYDEAF
ncbi:hypothetical protein [Pseudomonas sp. Sample_20]|uniref:hypothetical protein n=1 Tax=Pseudomonas sp. Sample_20 TaxID=2448264 RepID=UPI001032C35B|nr:hypothetical protein [Pseudomonas sp. Sample_20]